jgi:hypothetical protein
VRDIGSFITVLKQTRHIDLHVAGTHVGLHSKVCGILNGEICETAKAKRFFLWGKTLFFAEQLTADICAIQVRIFGDPAGLLNDL